MKTLREKELMVDYWVAGGGGALLLGTGLAVLLHGSKMKEEKEDPWFWVSTGGFALIMAGLSFIGNANRYRTLAEVRDELARDDR
ncbi:MAG: hypothetical protein H7Z72_04905 [Bacteroidetes bacterium]|nr:hypothetical protein [Fibrella sp.]